MSSQVSLGAHRVNVFEHNTGGRMNKDRVNSTRDSSGTDYLLLVLPFPVYLYSTYNVSRSRDRREK